LQKKMYKIELTFSNLMVKKVNLKRHYTIY